MSYFFSDLPSFLYSQALKTNLRELINRNAPVTIAASIASVPPKMLSISSKVMCCQKDKPHKDKAAIVIPARTLAVFLRILRSEKIKIYPSLNICISIFAPGELFCKRYFLSMSRIEDIRTSFSFSEPIEILMLLLRGSSSKYRTKIFFSLSFL